MNLSCKYYIIIPLTKQQKIHYYTDNPTPFADMCICIST